MKLVLTFSAGDGLDVPARCNLICWLQNDVGGDENTLLLCDMFSLLQLITELQKQVLQVISGGRIKTCTLTAPAYMTHFDPGPI